MSTQTTALQVLRDEMPTLKAITLFNYGPDKDVSSIIMNEISFLESIALSKPDIAVCERISIEQSMKFVLKNNLSFDTNAGLVYVKTRNIKNAKTGAYDMKIMEVQPTCEGLISIAYQCGKIIDHERPTVKKNDAGKVIEVTFRYMRPSPTGPRWVDISFDESDFKRWMTKSHQENSRGKADASTKNYANPNYLSFNGGIDPEFARAKSIRHALKKLGTNANERISINIKPSLVNTVDAKADILATSEESVSDVPTEEYHDFTEVPTTPQPSAQQESQPNNLPKSTEL
jgi:hypothetical protein